MTTPRKRRPGEPDDPVMAVIFEAMEKWDRDKHKYFGNQIAAGKSTVDAYQATLIHFGLTKATNQQELHQANIPYNERAEK